ncbi:hypothetical protein ACIQUB_22075 [Rhizobium sp. NPDC090275]|uniref:hypothetical protein n=1 Tax=Rhizobium sp. NPDC090275 TaxID=3364498 RepID=UPI00383A6CED
MPKTIAKLEQDRADLSTIITDYSMKLKDANRAELEKLNSLLCCHLTRLREIDLELADRRALYTGKHRLSDTGHQFDDRL